MYEMSSIPTKNDPPFETRQIPRPTDVVPLYSITEKLKAITNENFDLIMRLHEVLVGAYGGKPVCVDSPADRSTLSGDIAADLQVACGINEVIRDLYERLGISL